MAYAWRLYISIYGMTLLLMANACHFYINDAFAYDLWHDAYGWWLTLIAYDLRLTLIAYDLRLTLMHDAYGLRLMAYGLRLIAYGLRLTLLPNAWR